ncbi:MAG: VOC family protein [Bacteroidota bacterium]
MNKNYKPQHYSSLSPYLIVNDAKRLIDLLTAVFDATELRKFTRPDGKIAHVELKIDDSVIMISDSTDGYPANKTMLHLYVPDVFKTFDKAIENGCTIIEKPVNKDGDPDTRGSFYDFAGNYWAISTQMNTNE